VKAKSLNIPLVLDGVSLSYFLDPNRDPHNCLIAVRFHGRYFSFSIMLLTALIITFNLKAYLT
jgi:hypothetical protein